MEPVSGDKVSGSPEFPSEELPWSANGVWGSGAHAGESPFPHRTESQPVLG